MSRHVSGAFQEVEENHGNNSHTDGLHYSGTCANNKDPLVEGACTDVHYVSSILHYRLDILVAIRIKLHWQSLLVLH